MPRLYNYLKSFPDDCKELFLKNYNRNKDLSTITASPFLGLLNSGLQLFWLKHKKKEFFDNIQTTLHFPQYFTYLLSSKKFADITSVGCHTMLWNFGKKDYHEWVDRENIRGLLPPLHNANLTIDHTVAGTPFKMGLGVHDSSAALMPYLAVMKDKFLLLSTGTWNICFNPFNHDLLQPDELSQDCLCFLTFDGKPVKASRIFLGHEHELQQRAMAAYFNVDEDYYKSIDFNPDLYKRIKHPAASFKILGMQGTGPALASRSLSTNYSVFHDFEEAQHHLIRQLVLWQKISIDLIDPGKAIRKIIVVGGFTKSKLFLEIMKRDLPERQILVSDHPRASALGAAWLVCGEKGYSDKHKILNVLEA
jgi:sugar (pentulose or hexulose) kinase